MGSGCSGVTRDGEKGAVDQPLRREVEPEILTGAEPRLSDPTTRARVAKPSRLRDWPGDMSVGKLVGVNTSDGALHVDEDFEPHVQGHASPGSSLGRRGLTGEVALQFKEFDGYVAGGSFAQEGIPDQGLHGGSCAPVKAKGQSW